MILSVIGRHKKRFMSFMRVGVVVFLLSNLLLFGLVSLGASRWVAFVIQQPLCTATNYALNRCFTWKTRKVPVAKSLAAFVAVRVFTSVPKLALFVLMTYQLHVHYMLSNMLLIMLFGLVNYNLSDKLVFRKNPHAEDSLQPVVTAA